MSDPDHENPAADQVDAGEGGTGAPPPASRRNVVHGRKREYRDAAIVVQWYAERCIHSGACVRALPDVFDPQRRPWVILEGHSADEVAAAIEKCPTGALTYARGDGGPQERVPEITSARAMRNGPLFVRGNLRVTDASGAVLREAPRLAFCRCGRSGHMPFCDNTHRQTGFREPEQE